MNFELNRNQLKMIAIFAMLFDHVLWTLYPGYDNGVGILLLHAIGRLAAPIFCFFITEGYIYTRNVKKYALRLFLFSIVSHFAYCFAFGINYIPFTRGSIFNQTSVMWSLLLGLVSIMIYDSKMKGIYKFLLICLVCILAFPADWSMIGTLMVLYGYINKDNFNKRMFVIPFFTFFYALVFAIFLNPAYGILQMCTIFTIPLLKKYNNKPGNCKWMKWFFYIIYPAHLIICGLIRLALHGDIQVIG